MNVLIYDSEIRNGVATKDNPAQDGFKYAKGWSDFTGMGISVICAYDTREACFRIFMEDNLQSLVDLIAERDAVVGFNNFHFDDRLLEAHGIGIDDGRSIDLAALIWRAAGIPQGEHPKGLSLNACCQAAGLPTKSGNGADAPQDFQRNRFGRVIDYCLNDVRCTLHLYRYLISNGGLPDPRDKDKWLYVSVPR
jgi:hypothetical protein